MTSLDKIIPTKNKRYLSPIKTEKESESSLTKDNININNSKKKIN
jgi:hypothetical protein